MEGSLVGLTGGTVAESFGPVEERDYEGNWPFAKGSLVIWSTDCEWMWSGEKKREIKKYYQRDLRAKESTYGQNSREAATALMGLGFARHVLDDNEAAWAAYESALRIYERFFEDGETSPLLIDPLIGLALVLTALERRERAMEVVERALHICLHHYGENHPRIADGAMILGELYNRLNEHDRAIENYRRALRVKEAESPPDNRARTFILARLGALLYDLGEKDKAVGHYRGALHFGEISYGNNHPRLAKTRQELNIVQRGLTLRSVARVLKNYEAGPVNVELIKFHRGRPKINISSYVTGLAVLADGRLAVGSADGIIKIWDGRINKWAHPSSRTMRASDSIIDLVGLPNNQLASCHGHIVRIWDVETGRCLRKIARVRQYRRAPYYQRIYVLAALPNGQLLTGTTRRGGGYEIHIWDPEDGTYLHVLKGEYGGDICGLAVLPNGRLACGAEDGSIRIWIIAERRRMQALVKHQTRVISVVVLSRGRLASGSLDGEIKIWNVESRECLHTIAAHNNEVIDLTVLSDNRLASSSLDNTVKIWNLETGECLWTENENRNWPQFCSPHHQRMGTGLVALPDGRLVGRHWDAQLRVWEFGNQ